MGSSDVPSLDEPDPARLTEDEQTLGERDQTLSDAEQTHADADQTLSDRDQRASDDDQAASDEDVAQGGDEDAHERTTTARLEATRARAEVGDARLRTASLRDQAAAERDAIAAQRDHDADIADRRALEYGLGLSGDQQLLGEELRTRALEGRRRAALDRDRAARDRALAARDRELAARDRSLAEQALEQAGTDELTGARRRGVGLEEVQREIDRARRTDENLVAAYVDVDGLKKVNDQHGHSTGDQLLRDVVNGLREHMRSYDLLVRLGGDEFLCVQLGVPLDEAQQRFEALNGEFPEGPTARSVSFGFAELRPDEGCQALIDRADRELMAARRASRASTDPSSKLS